MINKRDFLQSKFPQLLEQINGLSKLESASRGSTLTNTFNIPFKDNLALIKSNTTILAIRCHDCIILGGDRRIAAGYDIMSDLKQKLYQLSSFSGIGLSGRCSSIQKVSEEARLICSSFEQNYNNELSIDGQAKILQHLVKYYWHISLLSGDEQYMEIVLAGYDDEFKKPRIFKIEIDGFSYEEEKFAGAGCGFSHVREMLNQNWRKDLNAETGLELIIEMLGYSGKASGGVSDIRISPPTAAIISDQGFKWVSEARIKKLVKSLTKKMGA